jgi:fructoselysine-6-P-deglycase FrlB-like protein
MKTIEAFENDVLLQIPYLQNIILQKQLPIKKQQKTIFCGTGDSYAAALLAESFSNYRIQTTDPLDLLKNPQIAKNKDAYIISISGNTSSNVKVAKLFKNTTAVTSNSYGKLVKSCSKKILLDFPSSGIFTSGSIGFLASALTCISLVSNIRIRGVLELFKQALLESKKVKLGKKIFILGNFHTFPVAMYGAAKFYELLGSNIHYCRIEQFLHMELFSAKPGDTVIILEETNPHNKRMIKNLKKLGLNVYQPIPGTKNKVLQVIFFTFFSQLTPLFYAKKNKQKDCYFVTAKKLRNASSNMIY